MDERVVGECLNKVPWIDLVTFIKLGFFDPVAAAASTEGAGAEVWERICLF